MNINIKATQLDLTPSLRVYIEDKIGGLTKFIKRFDETGQAEIWFEIGRTTRHHNKGMIFMAEADLRLPKSIIRGVEYHDDARKAIDALRRTMRIEIAKYKTQHSIKPKSSARKK